jgi:hypothetical protein
MMLRYWIYALFLFIISQSCEDDESKSPEECFDIDTDGYGIGSGCLGWDCDENDILINEGMNEICDNNKDDDCDGLIDESICHS